MKVAARVMRRRTFSTFASSASSRWSSSSVSSCLASLSGAIRGGLWLNRLPATSGHAVRNETVGRGLGGHANYPSSEESVVDRGAVAVEHDAQRDDAEGHPKEEHRGSRKRTAETEVATISIDQTKPSYAHARRLTMSERPEGGEVDQIRQHPECLDP